MWFKRRTFYQSREWRLLAMQHKAIEKAKGNWRCKNCGYNGWDLQSDHILSRKDHPGLALNIKNLQLLCGHIEGNSCNQKKGSARQSDPQTLIVLLRYCLSLSLRGAIVPTIIACVGFYFIKRYYF